MSYALSLYSRTIPIVIVAKNQKNNYEEKAHFRITRHYFDPFSRQFNLGVGTLLIEKYTLLNVYLI